MDKPFVIRPQAEPMPARVDVEMLDCSVFQYIAKAIPGRQECALDHDELVVAVLPFPKIDPLEKYVHAVDKFGAKHRVERSHLKHVRRCRVSWLRTPKMDEGACFLAQIRAMGEYLDQQ